ncbi:universal stress protein [Rhizorhapis suberifaciens]|uniref:Nucleotide-binding universal stress UspA family protein n=1 Tax=Rhizorhapis suberifaciens TaxID=13656 RepID=A0A840HV55_9SPHN|nr:universal stress protein [Rhizorhapis suberifaciens]MBB4641935.1 nucleotide-binding universal stress UspA family protein [Rhizorhapis suberifaciens]
MKSVLLHINRDSGQESRLQAALDLVRAQEGHLTCLQVTPIQQYVAMDPFGGSFVLPANLQELRAEEADERSALEERLRREGISWDWQHYNGDLVQTLLSASRLADVTVLTRTMAAPKDPGSPLPIAADVAVHARGAILAVPPKLASFDCCGSAVIAWNGSYEAAHALRSAVTLLAQAQEVNILTVEEDDSGFPATDASAYLSRHGIASELHEWARAGRTVEETIAKAIGELGASYLVMGAYGRSRLRETLFGGVTKHLMAECRVPLLLAH